MHQLVRGEMGGGGGEGKHVILSFKNYGLDWFVLFVDYDLLQDRLVGHF